MRVPANTRRTAAAFFFLFHSHAVVVQNTPLGDVNAAAPLLILVVVHSLVESPP